MSFIKYHLATQPLLSYQQQVKQSIPCNGVCRERGRDKKRTQMQWMFWPQSMLSWSYILCVPCVLCVYYRSLAVYSWGHGINRKHLASVPRLLNPAFPDTSVLVCSCSPGSDCFGCVAFFCFTLTTYASHLPLHSCTLLHHWFWLPHLIVLFSCELG